MKKLVVVSDSHLRPNILKNIKKMQPDADYYIHCGDSELRKKALDGFLVVEGNHDHSNEFDKEIELEIEGVKFFIVHGHEQGIHNIYQKDYKDYIKAQKKFVKYCEAKKPDVVLFGHIHRYIDEVYNRIHYINPGSLAYSRDWGLATYCVILVEDGNITVQKEDVPRNIF